MTLTIIILTITNLITAARLFYLLNRHKQLVEYTRKADLERIALQEALEFIRYK